jgi:hypothetical protein
MDYTTTALVKTAMGTSASTDDTQIAKLVTAASRAIDRHLAGAIRSDDYLKSETVSSELGRGIVDSNGVIHYWAHKPVITAVTLFSYAYDPVQALVSVDTTRIRTEGSQVMAYAYASRGRPFVTISYTGGLATTQAGLPEDVIEAATILGVRYYKEAKSGLSDSIGVAELGMLIYTKTWPIRVLDMLAPYARRIPTW